MSNLLLSSVVMCIGLLVNASILISVFSYKRRGATARLACSAVAFAIMCMCISAIMRILTGLATGTAPYTVFELFWQGFIGTVIIMHGGNISFFIDGFPPFKGATHHKCRSTK